jgi:hypothetical protein
LNWAPAGSGPFLRRVDERLDRIEKVLGQASETDTALPIKPIKGAAEGGKDPGDDDRS